MGKCEQCIIKQFNSLKSLTKDELMRISNCKTSKIIKKGEVIFEEELVQWICQILIRNNDKKIYK